MFLVRCEAWEALGADPLSKGRDSPLAKSTDLHLFNTSTPHTYAKDPSFRRRNHPLLITPRCYTMADKKQDAPTVVEAHNVKTYDVPARLRDPKLPKPYISSEEQYKKMYKESIEDSDAFWKKVSCSGEREVMAQVRKSSSSWSNDSLFTGDPVDFILRVMTRDVTPRCDHAGPPLYPSRYLL